MSTSLTVSRSTARSRLKPLCGSVRIADVGWTDVTATTALLSTLPRDLGYRPQVTVVSVPVTFASMKHGDIDALLGNWKVAARC